jgi:hypothetical protein
MRGSLGAIGLSGVVVTAAWAAATHRPRVAKRLQAPIERPRPARSRRARTSCKRPWDLRLVHGGRISARIR